MTVLNSQGRAVELGPVVGTLYSVPMSVQQAPRQLLDLDAITEMMEMAEQDVKMRL